MHANAPNAPGRLSQRHQAQRRLRHSAARRLFCSTNGCATFLEPEADGTLARCPVCGLTRALAGGPTTVALPAH